MAMPAETLSSAPSATFRLDAASLGAAIDACLPFVPRRPFRPILSSMLLRAVDGRVHLSATDLEDGVSVEVNGTGQGVLCLPAAVRPLPKAGAVEVTAEGPMAVGCGQMTLQLFDAEQFPEIPEPDGTAGSPLASAEVLHILTRAATCASTEETGRALLRCVSATADGQVLATDGFHVYVQHAPSATGASLGATQANVPAAFIARLNKPAVRKRLPESVRLTVDTASGRLWLHGEHMAVWTRCMEGKYFAVLDMLPGAYPTTFTVATANLAAACKRLLPIVKAEATHAVRVAMQGDHITVAATSADVGSATEDVEPEVQGPPLQLGFNLLQLLGALRLASTPNVTVECSGPQTIARMRLDGESTHYQMPLHLSAADDGGEHADDRPDEHDAEDGVAAPAAEIDDQTQGAQAVCASIGGDCAVAPTPSDPAAEPRPVAEIHDASHDSEQRDGTAESAPAAGPAPGAKIHDPDGPATRRQLWALHCLTHTDTRGWALTKAEASEIIGRLVAERGTRRSARAV